MMNVMKAARRRLIGLLPAAGAILAAGCHDDESDVASVLAIIYAVGDIVLAIIDSVT